MRRTSSSASIVKGIGDSLGGEYNMLVHASEESIIPVRRISSGCDAIDALIHGGYPEGKVTILHGAEATGKTTLALQCAREFQKNDGIVIYIDWEYKLNLDYARGLGVDLECMALPHPDSIEDGFEFLGSTLEKIRKKNEEIPILIVWDSWQAAQSKQRMKTTFVKADMNPEPHAYSRCLGKFLAILDRSKAVFLGISQVRTKIGMFVSGEKIAVGNAPMFYAVIILTLRSRKAKARLGLSGAELEAYLHKYSWGTPYTKIKFDFIYGIGSDPWDSALKAAEYVGLAVKPRKGSWWEVRVGEEVVKIQGAGGLEDMATKDPNVWERFRVGLREEIEKGVAAPQQHIDEDEEEDEENGGEQELEVPED